jgi:hypothetical protein
MDETQSPGTPPPVTIHAEKFWDSDNEGSETIESPTKTPRKRLRTMSEAREKPTPALTTDEVMHDLSVLLDLRAFADYRWWIEGAMFPVYAPKASITYLQGNARMAVVGLAGAECDRCHDDSIVVELTWGRPKAVLVCKCCDMNVELTIRHRTPKGRCKKPIAHTPDGLHQRLMFTISYLSKPEATPDEPITIGERNPSLPAKKLFDCLCFDTLGLARAFYLLYGKRIYWSPSADMFGLAQGNSWQQKTKLWVMALVQTQLLTQLYWLEEDLMHRLLMYKRDTLKQFRDPVSMKFIRKKIAMVRQTTDLVLTEHACNQIVEHVKEMTTLSGVRGTPINWD